MVTAAPGAPLVGEKLAIRGATTKLAALVSVPSGVVTLILPVVAPAGTTAVICGRSVEFVALVPVPVGVVTLMVPVVAPAGTVAVICVAESTWNVAAVPLNFTAVAPLNVLPVMVTAAPTAPLVGVKLVILG